MLKKLWFSAALMFSLTLIVCLLIIMLFNKGLVNHALTPILQYGSLFQVLWQENALGALQFIVTKSLFAFAHQDPRSGLNIWTFEVDSISFFVYLTVSLLMAWLIKRHIGELKTLRAKVVLSLGFGAAVLVCGAFSYMTAIEHCSGATWVGFVALYGLGFDEFELYPAYQTVTAIIGLIVFGLAVYNSQKRGQQHTTQ